MQTTDEKDMLEAPTGNGMKDEHTNRNFNNNGSSTLSIDSCGYELLTLLNKMPFLEAIGILEKALYKLRESGEISEYEHLIAIAALCRVRQG
tara:strand:+ start:637 stop:912 length:276 start_codon:yes stop_codon:yes gene_type:complete